MAPIAPWLAWVPEVLSRVTVASGVGYLAVAYTVSRWLTRRSPARLTMPASDGSVSWAAAECRTADGLRLRGWVATPLRPVATVALFHGMRLNRSAALGRIAFLTRSGYRCVAFDHRAHGESEGGGTSFGFHESRDAEAVSAWIASRWPGQPCAALGMSMGAAALCFADPTKLHFQAFLLESMYHNLAGAFAHRVGTGYPKWFRHFRTGIIWITERRHRMRIEQVAPAEHWTKLAPRPVAVLTGADDPHAPPNETTELFSRSWPGCELHLVPNAGHADVLEVGGHAYRQLVLRFLERCLSVRSRSLAA